MYVEDITDVKELLDIRAELVRERSRRGRYCEQLDWDIEDVEQRLWELGKG